MYKLTVVSGPNRGSTFPVQEGETTIGRQAGNSIVLPSGKISKRHCVLVLNGGQIALRDEGSSNGTFVNGTLTKNKIIKSGDRISIGEFVLELSEPPKRVQKPASAPGGIGIQLEFRNQFPGATRPSSKGQSGAPSLIGIGVPIGSSGNLGPLGVPNQTPTDFKGRALWMFENRFMPIFYSMILKYQWRVVAAGLFASFIIGNLIVSVAPLLESSRVGIVKEAGRRARFMAKQIAETNAPFLAAHAETKTEIGMVETADGVRVAVLMDMDNRIIAPGTRLNQYLATGVEGAIAVSARDLFRAGRETGMTREADFSTIVAVEPVKVLNPAAGRNQVVAMALVSIDTSISTPDVGEMGMVYSETMILTGLLGGFILLILYRLTLKPFEILNEDMDKALKGELTQVTHEFQIEELNPLWEIINSAVQRIPRSSSVPGGDSFSDGPRLDDFLGPLKTMGGVGTLGFVILDHEKKIIYLNALFEEISGIRSDQALGQSMTDVARDQAMGAFTQDLLDRTPVAGEGLAEDFDFSGISYKVHSAAYGTSGQSAKFYTMTFVKA